jgi:hypothetical protein
MEKEKIIFTIETLKELREELKESEKKVNERKKDEVNQLQLHLGGVLCGYQEALILINSKISYLEGILKEL